MEAQHTTRKGEQDDAIAVEHHAFQRMEAECMQPVVQDCPGRFAALSVTIHSPILPILPVLPVLPVLSQRPSASRH